MKEEQIRPHGLASEYQKIIIDDRKKLLENKNNFVEIPCPACQNNDTDYSFNKNGFNLVTCKKCETLFINPRPTMDMLVKYYQNSKAINYWAEKIYPSSQENRRLCISTPRAKKITNICLEQKISTQVLFDVGAGDGSFCEEIKKIGVFEKVIAIEPSHKNATVCRNKGLNTIEKNIENVHNIQKADVITNFELIEHLFCPEDFIKACKKNIKKNGLLIITTPNIKGFDLLTLKKLSNNIGGPNHLNYFNIKSISILLKKCGFILVEVLTPGKLDAELVRKKIISQELDVSQQPFLKHILIDEWENLGSKFQNFLAENLLSSHMWIIAKNM